jgi:hypothetical protein
MTEAKQGVNSFVSDQMLRHYRAMKPVLKIIPALLLLAACGPMSIYYRPGVSVTRMQNDTTNCQVAALKDAPVATQIRQRPPIFFPGRNICNASGDCYVTPGYWADGGIYTVDTNQDLRNRVLDMCMAKKGYQPVTLPACPSSAKNSVPAVATTKLPTLTSKSCVIRYNDDNWQIVNQD